MNPTTPIQPRVGRVARVLIVAIVGPLAAVAAIVAVFTMPIVAASVGGESSNSREGCGHVPLNGYESLPVFAIVLAASAIVIAAIGAPRVADWREPSARREYLRLFVGRTGVASVIVGAWGGLYHALSWAQPGSGSYAYGCAGYDHGGWNVALGSAGILAVGVAIGVPTALWASRRGPQESPGDAVASRLVAFIRRDIVWPVVVAPSAWIAFFSGGLAALFVAFTPLIVRRTVYTKFGSDYDWFDCRADCATVVDLIPIPPHTVAEWFPGVWWVVGAVALALAHGWVVAVTVIPRGPAVVVHDEVQKVTRWFALVWAWAGGVLAGFAAVVHVVNWVSWNNAVEAGFIPEGDPVPEAAFPGSPEQPALGLLVFLALGALQVAGALAIRKRSRRSVPAIPGDATQ